VKALKLVLALFLFPTLANSQKLPKLPNKPHPNSKAIRSVQQSG